MDSGENSISIINGNWVCVFYTALFKIMKKGNAEKERGRYGMLKWKKDYLTGEGVEDPEKIKNKLDAGKYVHGIYLLTLSDNPSNMFEIIPAAMLLQKSYYRICPEIIGMAKGKDEALEMVRSLVQETYVQR